MISRDFALFFGTKKHRTKWVVTREPRQHVLMLPIEGLSFKRGGRHWTVLMRLTVCH